MESQIKEAEEKLKLDSKKLSLNECSIEHRNTAKTENRQKPYNFKTAKPHIKTAETAKPRTQTAETAKPQTKRKKQPKPTSGNTIKIDENFYKF